MATESASWPTKTSPEEIGTVEGNYDADSETIMIHVDDMYCDNSGDHVDDGLRELTLDCIELLSPSN